MAVSLLRPEHSEHLQVPCIILLFLGGSIAAEPEAAPEAEATSAAFLRVLPPVPTEADFSLPI